MKKGHLVAAVSLGLMASIALAPIADAFGGRGGRGGGGAVGGRPSAFRQPGVSQGFRGGASWFGSPLGSGYNRSFPGLDTLGPRFGGFPGFQGFNRGVQGNAGFGSFIPWGASTVVYYGDGGGWGGPGNYPVTYYSPQFYAPVYPAPAAYPAPAVFAPPAAGSISLTPAPTSPPASTVVSFPSGRYELRGDGIAAPYQWVWIPNPPSLPPAPPTAPPADPAPPAPSAGVAPPPASQLYRWTDDQGTVHWTNRGEAVPTKHRNQAKYPPPA